MVILIVEDEPNVAELIRETLEAQEFRCLVARSSLEADRILQSQQVDALTVDLQLPGRDGLDWLQEQAVVRPDLPQRTLLVTGSVLDSYDRLRLSRLGVQVLSKPFRIERLVEAVRTLLDGRRGDPDAH